MEDIFKFVKVSLDAGHFKEAESKMLYICTQFLENASESEFLVTNLPYFFSLETGVITYINKILQKPNIETLPSCSKCFNTIHFIIRKYPDNMEDYLTFVIQLCLSALSNHSLNRRELFDILETICSLKTSILDESQLFSIYAKIKNLIPIENNLSILSRHLCILGKLTQHQCFQSKNREIYQTLLIILTTNSESQTIIEGAYLALDDLFTNAFDAVLDERNIYKLLMRDAKFVDDFIFKNGSRQCVIFISHHISKFNHFLLDSEKLWFNTLEYWLYSYDEKDVAAGFDAYDSLAKSFADCWQRGNSQHALFTAIIDGFQQRLTTPNAKVQVLALRGLGYMAAITAACFPFTKFDDLFTTLIQRVEYFLKLNASQTSKSVSFTNFADCVETIQHFFNEFMKRKVTDLLLIRRLVFALIKVFPHLPDKHHSRVVQSLHSMFMSLWTTSIKLRQHNKLIINFLSEVVREGTLWTCSHDPIDVLETSNDNKITYLDYLPLWLGLLQKFESCDVQDLYFDEHMKVLMRVCLKLQLKFEVKYNDCGAIKKEHSYENKFDNMIFNNFVMFYCDILSAAPAKQFKRWITLVSNHIIRRSMLLPSVLGFYKLLTACLRKQSEIGFFSKESIEQKEYVRLCFQNIKCFISTLLKQVKYNNAEVQRENILLILALPAILLKELSCDFTEIFAIAFQHRSNNYLLAEVAIDSLENWMKDQNSIVTHTFLKKVIPHLDDYLRCATNQNSSIQSQKNVHCSDLPHLQHKILLFLAKLPDEIVLELTSKRNQLQLNKVPANYLHLRLCKEDATVVLKLDEIYLRALDLAVNCSNRQTRVLACEVLHSHFSLFLGASQYTSSSELDDVFKTILPNILQLAADIDTAINTLFSPTMLQLAHWYAHPKNVNSSLSVIFLRSILEGASHGNNAAIRDVSGKVLQEFVAWTLRQNTKSDLIQNLHNIKLIIENMKLFCLHPDEVKRYGACIIFLSIYKEFQHEEILVNMFLLELLCAFMKNLSLTENSRSSLLIVNVNECLSKLHECLVDNQILFHLIEGEHKRITPSTFESNNVDGIARFLIDHSSSHNLHCRRKAIEILNSLTNVSDKIFKEVNIHDFNHGVNANFLDIQRTEEVLQYYSHLTCWIDGQIFCAKHSLVENICDSNLFEAVNFALCHLLGKDLKEVQALLNISHASDENMVTLQTSFVSEQINLTEKLIQLFEVLINSNLNFLINDNFFILLVKYLFERDSLGLSHKSEEQWSHKTKTLLESYFEVMKVNNVTNCALVETFNAYIIKISLQQVRDRTDVPMKHFQFIRGLILLLSIEDVRNKVVIPKTLLNPLGKLFHGVVNQETEAVLPQLNDSFRSYYSLQLEFALDTNNSEFSTEFQTLVKLLGNAQIVKHPDLDSDMELGYYIFLTFKDAIFKYTVTTATILRALFEHLLEEASPPMISRLFKEYLAYLQVEKNLANKDDIKREVINIINCLWKKVFKNSSFDDLIDLIQDLHQTFGYFTSTKLFTNVWLNSTWNKKSDLAQTPLQKIQMEMNRIRILGIIAPYTDCKEVEDILKDMKKTHLTSLQKDFNRITTTLFIDNLIEATYKSTCVNFVMYGIDLFLRLQSDCVMNVEFCKELLSRLPRTVHETLINAIYDIDIKDLELTEKIKQTQIVCDLLAYCSYTVFESFFVRQIYYILDAFSQRCFDNKILSCILLNRLFANLDMKKVNGKTCKITKKASITVVTGKELIRRVADILLPISSNVNHGTNESYRLYQCYSYNALASLVCNTLKDQPEFYARLLVRHNEKGQDVLWSSLVHNIKFEFKLTPSSSRIKQKVLSDIQARKVKEYDRPAVNYIESQHLFFSSLSEDITNYDFSHVHVRDNICRTQNPLVIRMSDADVMRHESILHICAVIKHMHKSNMLTNQPVPRWIKDISSLLLHKETANNVRQFLSKIIEISQEYLKPYAAILTSGIILTIVDTCTSINSLASDLIIMLLTTWNFHKPSIREASMLLSFIMRNIYNDDSKLFKFNTCLMKKMVETNRNFEIDYRFIETVFFAEPKYHLSGIYIISIIAVNKICPFRVISSMTIFNRLLQMLESVNIEIYLASAETLGVILRCLKSEHTNKHVKFADKLDQVMRAMLEESPSVGMNNRGKVIQILEAVAKTYPELSYDSLENLQTYIFDEKQAIFKALSLKILLNCIRVSPKRDFIRKLKLFSWLKEDNLEVQILSLELLLGVLEHLHFSQIESILNVTTEMPNRNVVYRSIMTDIYIRLYEMYGVKNDAKNKRFVTLVKKFLLCGFADPVPEIRIKICKFWSTAIANSENIHVVLLDLLENFHIAGSEHLLIPFCNFILLKHFPICNKPLFEYPLHLCEYRDNDLVLGEMSVRSLDESNKEDVSSIMEMRNSFQSTSKSYIDIPDFSSLSLDDSKDVDSRVKADKQYAIVKKHKNAQLADDTIIVYGAYKLGDFPCINKITAQSVVNLVIELSNLDQCTSHLLFKSSYDMIQTKVSNVKLLPRVSNSINEIFRSCETSNIVLIKSLLHIAYKNAKKISCDPLLIARVSSESGAFSNGCLLLEEYLIKEETESEASGSKKGVGIVPSKEIKCWMKLAELYNNLEEFDTMHGIIADKAQSPQNMVHAIRAESERRWSQSRQLYAELIKIDYHMDRKDLYYDAFLRCSQELCDWKEMEQYCNQAINTPELTLDTMINYKNGRIGSICLPYYVKSKVMQSIQNDVEFATHIQHAFKNPSSRMILDSFSNYFALMSFDKANLKMASSFAATFENKFLQSWPTFNPLHEHVQKRALLQMKNCAEIVVLLDAWNTCTSNNYSDVIQDICKSWQTAAHYKPTLAYYEERHYARQAFLNNLKLKILSEDPSNQLIETINQLSFKDTANLINLAVKEDNFTIARMNLAKLTKVSYQDDSRIMPVWNLLKSKSILCKSKHVEDRKTYLLVDAFKNYFKCIETPAYESMPELWIPTAIHLRTLCEQFSVYSENTGTVAEFDDLKSYFKDAIDRISDLNNFAYDTMRNNVNKLEALQLQCHHSELADAFLVLSKDAQSRGEAFVNQYIEFTLKSMKYGSENARLLFPDILKLDELQAMYKTQFILQTSEIPSWMFICWIPQLLAYLDTATISAIKHIVLQIAIDYPQSMIYSYKLSKEKYSYDNVETYTFVQRLDEIFTIPLIDELLQELKYVCVPSSYAKAIISRLKKSLQSSEDNFKTLVKNIENILPSDRKFINSLQNFKKQLIEVFEYSNSCSCNKDEILKRLDAIEIDNISNENCNDLGFFSAWLLNFQAADHKCEIEVPGQYTGQQKPLPHYHAKIYQFSRDVRAFHSYRKPIRITIYGNDARKYRFLVKCGEDLRMDQRIQQLFKIMNSILSKDINCNERKLKMETFEVIPLSTDLGFIQWVENTDLLVDVICKYSGVENIQSILKAASDKYSTWIAQAAHIPDGDNIYAKALLHYSKEEATTCFLQIANSIPWNALRQAFINLSPSIETFFALRQNFVKCFALMNLCNWLLGIGDRHPENILIGMDRGNVIGIDFGHAFGSAVQQQAVPELVPIRLTPQILNLMQPLGASGLLAETMTTALRALRADHDILLSTMHIFVIEPTLDNVSSSILECAKAKFNGGNPIHIMMSEVRLRKMDATNINAKYIECLDDVLQKLNFQKVEDLSAKEQVDCLIAQATDANLLARMFKGWAPWI